MERHIVLDIQTFAKAYMWFRPLTPDAVDAVDVLTDATEGKAQPRLNYDFERRPDNEWQLHVDVGLQVTPVAEILTRTSFRTIFEGPLEHILNMAAMNDVVAVAIESCLQGFNEQCAATGIAYRHERIEMDIAKAVEYLRSNFASEHVPVMDTWRTKQLLKFTPGGKTMILCKLPFMIMDRVFFTDAGFDIRNNAAILFKHVPEPFYYTTKLRCMTIDKGDVELTGTHSVYYLICLDCALQLLVGEHENRLHALEVQGLTPQVRRNFLTWGTEFFEFYRTELAGKGWRVTNFENRPDWNAVIS
jgi:hypothetical protein